MTQWRLRAVGVATSLLVLFGTSGCIIVEGERSTQDHIRNFSPKMVSFFTQPRHTYNDGRALYSTRLALFDSDPESNCLLSKQVEKTPVYGGGQVFVNLNLEVPLSTLDQTSPLPRGFCPNGEYILNASDGDVNETVWSIDSNEVLYRRWSDDGDVVSYAGAKTGYLTFDRGQNGACRIRLMANFGDGVVIETDTTLTVSPDKEIHCTSLP